MYEPTRIEFKKTVFLLFALVCLLFALVIGANLLKPAPDYNLILISVDTLRPDHMGLYGYSKNTTPNIDKWAKNATVFTNVRVETPQTYPSFTTLMTGESAFEMGIFTNSVTYDGESLVNLPYIVPIDDKTVTLAQILKKNGYKTAAFLNTPSLEVRLTNINKGFDTYKNDYSLPWTGPDQREIYKSYGPVNEGLKWLKANKDSRFFLWLHILDPHFPYTPIDEFKCTFNIAFCGAINAKGYKELEAERRTLTTCNPQLSQDTIDLYKTLYDGGVASADKLLSTVFSTIEKENLNKNTVIIFYGDHGEGFDHSYYFEHGSALHDSQVRIPFMVKRPNIKHEKINDYISNGTLFNLILNLLKVNNDKQTTEKLVAGQKTEQGQYIFFVNSLLTKYAVQHLNYKYIYTIADATGTCLTGNTNEELYDIKNDPDELKNLAQDNKQLSQKLKSVLMEYIKEHNFSDKIKKKLKSIPQETIEQLKSLGY